MSRTHHHGAVKRASKGVQRARLDENRDAKPRTRLTYHPAQEGECVSPFHTPADTYEVLDVDADGDDLVEAAHFRRLNRIALHSER